MVIEQDKLDYELFDRWLKFLAKPPKFYPYLKAWQEMIKRGGTKEEAKKLADEFQKTAHRRHVRAARDQGRERHHRGQGAAHHQEEEAGEPAERVHHQRRLLSGLRPRAEDAAHREDEPVDRCFLRDLQRGLTIRCRRRTSMKPGLLAFRGWGLERQLSADRRAYIDALRADIETMQEGNCRRTFPTCTA